MTYSQLIIIREPYESSSNSILLYFSSMHNRVIYRPFWKTKESITVNKHTPVSFNTGVHENNCKIVVTNLKVETDRPKIYFFFFGLRPSSFLCILYLHWECCIHNRHLTVLSLLASQHLLGQAQFRVASPQWCGLGLLDNLFGVRPTPPNMVCMGCSIVVAMLQCRKVVSYSALKDL